MTEVVNEPTNINAASQKINELLQGSQLQITDWTEVQNKPFIWVNGKGEIITGYITGAGIEDAGSSKQALVLYTSVMRRSAVEFYFIDQKYWSISRYGGSHTDEKLTNNGDLKLINSTAS